MRAQLAFAALALLLVTAAAAASTAADAASLSLNDPLVTEPDSGTRSAVFSVRLSAAVAEPVTVEYATADDSAKAPEDYAAASGTLTFSPGETAKQVTVAVSGDLLDEPHETFRLELLNASGATFGDARGIGTILDNDPAVSLSVEDVSASEASGALEFRVSLSGRSGKVVTASYAAADGSATAPGDYASTQGTLVFMPGETAKSVAVPVTDDDLVEPDETVTLTISNAVNALLGGYQGLGTITNDDSPPAPPGDDPPLPPGEDPPPPGEDPPLPPPEDPPGEEEPPGPTPLPANGAPDCSAVAPSVSTLWAPNHKLHPVYFHGANDPEGDPVEYEIASVTQDEPRAAAPDAKRGEHGHGLWLRAERLGKGDGRVYRIEYNAWDDHGNSCGGKAVVTVPHDRDHPNAVDSGASWDSFGF